MTVLAGFTAFLSLPLIPSSVEAEECGDVSTTKTVTCDAATYGGTSATDANPIEYTGQTGGLTLTVRPSGEMTTIKSFLPPENPATSPADLTQGRNSGIIVIGRGALTVKLEGKARIVNEAGWTNTAGTYSSGSQQYSATFIEPRYRRGSRNYGIVVENDEAGLSSRTDKIEIVIGAEARIGTEEIPVGRYGVFAYYRNASAEGDMLIVNRGEIYGYYRGIYAHHEGSGDITVETAKGSVTSKGILVNTSNSGEGGDIRVTNHGTLQSPRQRPLYAKTLSGGEATLYDGDIPLYNQDGIQVQHRDETEGAADNPSSTITITSSGDIRARRYGISIVTRGDEDSVVPVTVDVTGGVITAGEADKRREGELGNGIYVHSDSHSGGLIKVDLAGEIAWTGIEGDGIYVYRTNSADSDDPANQDVEVTLKSGARIGMNGDEPTVGRHGVWIEQWAHGGTLRVTISEGARIGTTETPVGVHGVLLETDHRDDENDMMISNKGLVHARSSGLVGWNHGWGNVVVEHLKGEIIAGDAPNLFENLGEDDQTQLVLKPRTAGIFAFHGGSKLQTLPGETFEDNDPSTYTAEVGEIKITSKADITSKGDGVLAYVKDIDVPNDIVFIPIMIDVAGGTITADGHGVYAETATTYEDEDAPKAGRIEVTVGEMATIRAKKDGVHVKGMRTFASDHARKGQYDQTVTINGKVMGGGGDHAGVRVVKGGTLVIGSGGPEARLGAASGVAVHADGALTITMSKTADGRIGWVVGKIQNGDSGDTTFAGVEVGKTYLLQDWEETKGIYDTTIERKVTLREYADEDYHEFELVSQEEIVREYHDRARVYEALPSVLLEMSAPGGRQARLSATRDGGGAWARVLASDGEREAETSTTAMDTAGHDLSWDFERWGVETGFAVPTDLPGVTLGVSAHYRDGEADVERGGKIEVSGVGVGASATWRGEDGWYADGELSYTRFEDVDLSSEARGMVASGLDGDGHAIGVEVGRRLEMDGFALVPRGGLTWTWVDVDGFDDVSGVTGSGRVSFRSEDSARARVGMLLENGQTYASLDVERELSESREVMASGSRLRSEVESTWARVGVGGVMVLDEKGESTLSGEAHYAASDGDNEDYGASVLLKVRF